MKEKKEEKGLYTWEALATQKEIQEAYETSPNGLSEELVQKHTQQYGKNQMKQKAPKKWYHYLAESFMSPFNLILLAITLVLCYTDVILPETPSYANILVILVLISVSTILEFVEVYHSNQAAEKLKQMVATSCTVIRAGVEQEIPLDEVVVGDVVVLSAGSIIPADLRIIEANDLYVAQSSLTGESEAVPKQANSEKTKEEIEAISDLDTIGFTGTNVTSGYGKGIAIRIGDETYFGKVADSITNGKPKTAFQKGVESISKLLIRFMLYMIPITFLINIWKHGDVIKVFTFSVAIAIGITPLLLPVILSSSLAKGATRMAKKKTIIKRLESIQSFGAMNILCTDKTGTLTEDKIVLEKYLNVQGEEDFRVLQEAYQNAYFQTGLKGNMDEAILARGSQEGMEACIKRVEKVAEIPFDFSRRRLSVILKEENGTQKIITKGAIEEILSICNQAIQVGKQVPMTKEMQTAIRKKVKALNEQGLRVLGVCQKELAKPQETYQKEDEQDMVLVGFVGFLDPPKESAKEAILRLNENGIRVIVLTGDNEAVAKAVCDKVDLHTDYILLGSQVDQLTDLALKKRLRKTNIFAKLSPIQKARIVRLLGEDHIVGYLGDGINDSPSLRNAEVGISVDTAVDIAKETADVILLEKNLNVLTDGAREGRKTFCNLMKYIKLAISFNFGEVLSVVIASIFLPFFPITPIQLLVQSLIYDIGQLSLPMDNVDDEYTQKPRKWDLTSVKHFMLIMGVTSSIFDLIVFSILWFVWGIRADQAARFQTIWFSYGIVSNLIGLHIIRTAKIPFLQSNASTMVYTFTIVISILAILVPFTILGSYIGLVPLQGIDIGLIFFVPLLYCIVALGMKRIYQEKFGEWI